MKTPTMDLACDLTEDETRESGVRLADAYGELEQLELTKESLPGRIKAKREEISELARRVSTQREHRAVPIEYRHDVGRLVVETIRLDTGAVVQSRLMSGDERERARQPELPGTAGGTVVSIVDLQEAREGAITVGDDEPLRATVGEHLAAGAPQGDIAPSSPRAERSNGAEEETSPGTKKAKGKKGRKATAEAAPAEIPVEVETMGELDEDAPGFRDDDDAPDAYGDDLPPDEPMQLVEEP